jgi:hypothetical protein
MKVFVIGLFCLFVDTSVQARLGWTKAQMEEKFGKASYTNSLVFSYRVDKDNKIRAMYDGDKVVLIEYIKMDGATEGKTLVPLIGSHWDVNYTDVEVGEILEVNFPGTRWMKNNKAVPMEDVLVVTDSFGSNGKDWVEYRSGDGLVYAYQCLRQNKLGIFNTVKKTLIANLRRQQMKLDNEARKKGDTLGVKGKF